MTERPLTLDSNLTVDDFARQVALTHRFSTYPLVDSSGRLTGLVTLNRVRAVSPAERVTTRLWQIACAPNEVPTAHPNESLVELLRRMHGWPTGAPLFSTMLAGWSGGVLDRRCPRTRGG